MYCVRCKEKTQTNDLRYAVSKNKRPMLRGKCTVCGSTKTQFVPMSKGGDLVSSLSSLARNVKLPWAKYPGEMHLP